MCAGLIVVWTCAFRIYLFKHLSTAILYYVGSCQQHLFSFLSYSQLILKKKLVAHF